MTSKNWSLKAEALYYNLGNMSVPTTSYSPEVYDGGAAKSPGSGVISTSGNAAIPFQGLIARAGINYHFDAMNYRENNTFEGIFSAITRRANDKNISSDNAGTWDGVYLGMNTGYGFGTNNSTAIANDNIIDPWTGRLVFLSDRVVKIEETNSGLASSLSGILSMKQGGFVGGGQAGYNYTLSKNYLVGLETDIQGTSIRGSNATTGFGYSAVQAEEAGYLELSGANSGGQTFVRAGLNWIGTVRARAGYLWTASLLTYATAGLAYGGAYANVKNNATVRYFVDGIDGRRGSAGGQQVYGASSNTDTLVGYNVGGGFELLLNQNWSLKTEALYYNLGSMNIRTNSFASAIPWVPARWITGNTNVNFQGIITRVGLNYHLDFGRAAPVVAKY